MEFLPCNNCVGPRQEMCLGARLAVAEGLEQTAGLDPDLQAMATLDMSRRVGGRIIKNGYELSLSEIQQQLVS